MSADPTLMSVIGRASRDDLAPLADLLHDKSVDFVVDKTWSTEVMRKELEAELRANGGNTFANLRRGEGPPWAEIVRDVAKKMKVKFRVSDSTADIEAQVAATILERAIEEMSDEQRAELRENLVRAGLPRDLPLGQGALVAGIAGGRIAGFAAYKALVIVANAVARALIGRGLTFAANAVLTKVLSVALGPIGWALSAVLTIIDVAGPASRVTIPSVVLVAVLRAEQTARREDALSRPLEELREDVRQRASELAAADPSGSPAQHWMEARRAFGLLDTDLRDL